MSAKLTLAERETILRFSEEPGDVITFETFNKRQALRLINAGAIVKRTSTRGGVTYWTLEFAKDWFRWPRKPSASRAEASKRALLARGGHVGVPRERSTATATAPGPSEGETDA